MGEKWNKKEHGPVIDPKGAGGPGTKEGHESGKGRANVVPQPKPAPPPPKKTK